ncbi:MAG: universal stress protein [Bacteroidales bacterium]|nr:universal stress protein [Bacteroidales bacterium]MDD4830071.1 universal stress protein [Bacteroidales bacterium]
MSAKIIRKSAVLVPYDFGPKSVSALKEAVTITKYLKGEIYLLSVIRKGDFFSQLFRSDKDNRRIQREVTSKLKEIATQTKKETGVRVITIIEQGNPIDVILEQATILNAQYIVMGKMENSTLDFNIFGSNNMQIVSESTCPIITVSEKTINENGFKNIVLPIDLTKQTLEKLVKALSWAKYYKSTIHLVGVLSGGISSTKSRLNIKMNKAKYIIEQEGINCSAELYDKSDIPVHKVILDHAKKMDGDLLMIMTHQELGVRDNYIGAVAQKMLKESEIPVISFTSKAIEHNNYFVSSFLPFELLDNKDLKHLKG